MIQSVGEGGPITTREFPAGPGAQRRWTTSAGSLELAIDVVYLYHDGQLVTFTSKGTTPEDLALIVESFRFRIPPGDPMRPPSQVAPAASP